MIRALVLILALAGPGKAETARVFSGEHADFTRLVIELPQPGGWRFGRTAMGYAFAAENGKLLAYDLTRLWQRIPRTRLQSVRVDPFSGALTLILSCSCHILPFEYRPGTVVLDIRNGPAPPGSAFEVPFAEAASTGNGAVPNSGAPLVYNWREDFPDKSRKVDSLPLATGGVSLAPLRDALLAQISRGVAEGLVDVERPLSALPSETSHQPDWARIWLGAMPGVEPGAGEAAEKPVSACISDSDLALSDWGGGRPALELLVEARSGLYGEFDALASDAVVRSVQLHVYLGFGAEARQLAGLLPETERTEILVPLLSMAQLVDGYTDPAGPFAAMLHCNGHAALWAALAPHDLPATVKVNSDAIVRSFTALPPHLRRHLGPRLANLLLPVDAVAARIVRDVMARTPDVSPGQVAVADSQAELLAGRPEEARQHAERALKDGAPIEGLVALVEAHAAALKPLSPDQAEAVLAWLKDAGNGPEATRLMRAAGLALALSGQTDRAFALAEDKGQDIDELWRVTVALADDSAFLVHAIRPFDAKVPSVEGPVAMMVAARLLASGFPDSALAWLGQIESEDPAEKRLMAAEAELDRGDPRRAMSLLDGTDGPRALDLRLRAEIAVGAFERAQRNAERAGLAEEAARLALLRADWSGLAATEVDPWAEVASFARPGPVIASGPLGRGVAVLETSAAARTAVEAMLSAVPSSGP